MSFRATHFAAIAAAAALSGCGWLPDAYSGCDEARPYQSAKDAGPLRVPAGADLHNMIRRPSPIVETAADV